MHQVQITETCADHSDAVISPVETCTNYCNRAIAAGGYMHVGIIRSSCNGACCWQLDMLLFLPF